MRKISFFVLNIFQIGGIERVVTILANNLVNQERFQVEIISLFKTSNNPAFKLDKRVTVQYIFDKPLIIRKNFVKIIKGCRKFAVDADVDILITAGMGYVPVSWLSFKPNKHIAWEHSNITIGKRFGITWFGRQIARKYLDYIVVLTERDMNNYKKVFKDKVTVKHIYNPIEFETSETSYNADIKKIISSGRLAKQKGFDLLVDVARIVFSKHPEWTWDIYGEGDERILIEEKISNYGLEKNVFVKGFVNDIKKVYSDYSFFVLTSRYEGFGLVITEAQSQKLPVVTFDCNCGPSELVINGNNGYLIENGNISMMAEKICNLIEDRDKRIEFSMKAHLDKDKLRLDYFVRAWKELIES